MHCGRLSHVTVGRQGILIKACLESGDVIQGVVQSRLEIIINKIVYYYLGSIFNCVETNCVWWKTLCTRWSSTWGIISYHTRVFKSKIVKTTTQPQHNPNTTKHNSMKVGFDTIISLHYHQPTRNSTFSLRAITNPTYQTKPDLPKKSDHPIQPDLAQLNFQIQPNLQNPTHNTQPTKPNQPNLTFQTKPTKHNITKPNLQNQNKPTETNQTKPTNQTFQTKPNLLNQTCKT